MLNDLSILKVNPINSESINQWVDKFEDFNASEIRFAEPLLKKFNYSFEIIKKEASCITS